MTDHTSESYQRLVDEIYPILVEIITRRYQNNKHKSVQDVYQLDQDLLSLEPDTLQFALAYRKDIVNILDNPELLASLVRLFVISTLEFTYENNQVITVGTREELALERIYEYYLNEMKRILSADLLPEIIKEQFDALIARHFLNLRNNLAGFLDNPGSVDVSLDLIVSRWVILLFARASVYRGAAANQQFHSKAAPDCCR